MSADDEIDVSASGARTLSAEEYFEWRRVAIGRAHRLRSRYALAVFVGLATAMAGVVRSVGATLRRMSQARADRQAIARLHSLDDGALKDIGLRRSEIESVVHGHGTDTTRLRVSRGLEARAKAA